MFTPVPKQVYIEPIIQVNGTTPKGDNAFVYLNIMRARDSWFWNIPVHPEGMKKQRHQKDEGLHLLSICIHTFALFIRNMDNSLQASYTLGTFSSKMPEGNTQSEMASQNIEHWMHKY